MITARRDYFLRMIAEVGRALAQLTSRRKRDESDEAGLETVVFGLQRLFGLDADQIFLLTPDQYFEMLSDDEFPEFIRDRLLLYAALNSEAGHIYARKGKREEARLTFTTALRFVLKAEARFGTENLPDYAPRPEDLLAALGDTPLDPDTAALLRARTPPSPPLP